MDSSLSDMALNLSLVRDRIEQAALRAGRSAEDITLIAVSKMHSPWQIRDLYMAGVRHFGENRVQEWEAKRALLSDLDATWHMIGHVQGNKAAKAVRLFDSIDSLDSVALAEKLDRTKKDFNTQRPEKGGEIEKEAGRDSSARLRVLIEVKLDPGKTKSGVSGKELAPLVQAVLQLPYLDLQGLMGVPPYFDDAEKARPYFRRLRELRDSVHAHARQDLLPVLSMGMSHDFEVAIEEGATEVRVGTALFGERGKA
jgi:pyridoxal phosphate enzyme (YggS family)